MSFTDDDLKRLKEYMEMALKADESNNIAADVLALLARLEAAEKVCKAMMVYREHLNLTCDPTKIGLDQWRKACGEMSTGDQDYSKGMRVPESQYANQKCACFIEIERLQAQIVALESQNKLLREALEAVALPPYKDYDLGSLLETLRVIAKNALTKVEE